MQLTDVLNQTCLHIRIWQEYGYFIAKCLDIPGCVSQGNTREEALTNIQDAITLCLEVIADDAEAHVPNPQVEVVERPMSEFLVRR